MIPCGLTDLRTRRDALFKSECTSQRDGGAGTVGDSGEGTGGVRESRDKRIPGKVASFRYNTNRLAHPTQHLMNHSAYLRDQISLMLQLEVEPPATDFHDVSSRDSP